MDQQHEFVEAAEVQEVDEAAAEFFEDLDLNIGDASMLLGTMRDYVLDGLRKPVGWAKLSEAQQHSINVAVEHGCKVALRGAFKVAAARSYPSMEMQIVGVTKNDKRVIEAKLRAPYNLEDWRKIGEAAVCILLPGASSEDYEGSLPAQVDKDQTGLFADGTETPAEKAKREAIEAEAREHEESVARARKFKHLDDAPTIDNDTGAIVTPVPAPVLMIAPAMSPELSAATDRGVAHRQAGGGRKYPVDLEGKDVEIRAWLKGYDTADASADGHAVDGATGEVKAEPAKPPRGHRGKRLSADERTAKRLADADA